MSNIWRIYHLCVIRTIIIAKSCKICQIYSKEACTGLLESFSSDATLEENNKQTFCLTEAVDISPTKLNSKGYFDSTYKG